MKGVVIVVLAMLVMSGFMAHPSEAITCPDVDRLLGPCLPYLRSSGGTPPKECCDGLVQLKASATTKIDRQTACNCAKIAAITLQIKADAAARLPGICGITINVPISASVDCSTVSLYESYQSRAWRLFDGM